MTRQSSPVFGSHSELGSLGSYLCLMNDLCLDCHGLRPRNDGGYENQRGSSLRGTAVTRQSSPVFD
jgi:hypothetical protein